MGKYFLFYIILSDAYLSFQEVSEFTTSMKILFFITKKN